MNDQAFSFLHLVGEAISDDVEAWDLDEEERELVATRDGTTFRLRLVEVTEDGP